MVKLVMMTVTTTTAMMTTTLTTMAYNAFTSSVQTVSEGESNPLVSFENQSISDDEDTDGTLHGDFPVVSTPRREEERVRRGF